MTTNEFKEYVKTRQALNTEEIHRIMDKFLRQKILAVPCLQG